MPFERKRSGENRKRGIFGRIFRALLLLASGAVLALCLYGVVVWRTTDENGVRRAENETKESAAAPMTFRLSEGTLNGAWEEQTLPGGDGCVYRTARWMLEDGTELSLTVADGKTYLTTLPASGWEPRPVTGFVLAGEEAACWQRGRELLLCAEVGGRILLLSGELSDDAIYRLGNGAVPETAGA